MTGAVLLLACAGVPARWRWSATTQTDPSSSTAAGGAGRTTGWAGPAPGWPTCALSRASASLACLLLPLLYAFARKLWRDAERGGDAARVRWWRAVCMLLLAMALLGTVLSLIDRTGRAGPAGRLRRARRPARRERDRGGRRRACPTQRRAGPSSAPALACLAGGAFARRRGSSRSTGRSCSRCPTALQARCPRCRGSENCRSSRARRSPTARAARAAARASAEVGQPQAARDHRPDARRAKPRASRRQGAARRTCSPTYELPSLDLLADPPPDKAPEARQAGARTQRAPARNRARRFQRQGRDHRGAHRPGGDDVRARTRARASRPAA